MGKGRVFWEKISVFWGSLKVSVKVGGSRVHMDFGEVIENEICEGLNGEGGKGKEVLGYIYIIWGGHRAV